MYYPLIVTAFTTLSLFIRSANAVAFALDPGSYPEVTDHHCIAFYCSGLGGFQESPTGFHRDTNSGVSERNRRHAIGCDGVTDCHTSTTGLSCDEIPYASTFDGGLGCFSSGWTNSGHSINSLYNVGTHRCVNAVQNSAHGQALTTFYSQNNIQNLQEFTLVFKAFRNGCVDPRSTWCVRFLNAVRAGQSVAPICASATSQRSYAKVTTSAYTRYPRCPSRNYRRDAESDDELANNTTTASTSFAELTADMLQVATLDNGVQVLPMLGAHKLGDEVWLHDDTFKNGKISKVVGVSSFKEHFRKLGRRQTC